MKEIKSSILTVFDKEGNPIPIPAIAGVTEGYVNQKAAETLASANTYTNEKLKPIVLVDVTLTADQAGVASLDLEIPNNVSLSKAKTLFLVIEQKIIEKTTKNWYTIAIKDIETNGSKVNSALLATQASQESNVGNSIMIWDKMTIGAKCIASSYIPPTIYRGANSDNFIKGLNEATNVELMSQIPIKLFIESGLAKWGEGSRIYLEAFV